MAAVSDHTRKCAARLFADSELHEVVRLLEEKCPDDGERIHCAVLRISRGEIPRLLRAMKEVRIDYRDVLMAADFGLDVEAHKQWHGEP